MCYFRKRRKHQVPLAPLMSVGSRNQVKLVTTGRKWVVKRVIFSFTVAKQKTTPKKVKHGKDGRIVYERRPVQVQDSSSICGQLLTWTWCLICGRPTKTNPPKEKLSKLAISKQTSIPYTTVCERLSGCHGGGRRGKIGGGKCQLKVLDEGKQTGNIPEQ